jgi:BirA family biotin operon repressor/biotin-[acetyl-CoA-carboxylase] ligase
MNITSLQKALSNLHIGGLRYFDSIGSTNDEALAWGTTGAKDFSIVIADEQTRGRGKLHRTWQTPKGSAIAISLILRLDEKTKPHLSRTVGMSALAISDSLRSMGLSPKIKWPNDVLLNGKKVAGILVESVWSGSNVDSLVIGMGINVYKNSTPPHDSLQLPATSLEDELEKEPLPREEIVKDILFNITSWREKLSSDEMLKTWEERLAFRYQLVTIFSEGNPTHSGVLSGLGSDGSLQLINKENKPISIHFGEVSLRPTA